MKMLLIYYNPNHNSFYEKIIHSVTAPEYRVGYINQYQHQIIQIFYITHSKIISCADYWDYIKNSKEEEPKINSLIDGAIRVLNKFKKK